MRITFLSPPPNLSGGERVIAIYARELIELGHEVEIVCNRKATPSLKSRLKRIVATRRVLEPPSSPSHYENYEVPFRIVEHSNGVLDSDLPDADVVIATYWRTTHWLPKIGREKGSTVYFFQDYGAPGQTWDLLTPTLTSCGHMITLCQWLADEVLKREPNTSLTIVRNAVDPVDPAILKSPRNPRQFGLVYRKTESKGCSDAFHAMALASEKAPIELVIFGEQPDEEQLAVFDRVESLGRIDEDQILKTYATCRGWLFPSHLEGFGLPILEAMSCGTPVIGTNAGAGSDLIDAGGGIMVGVGDVQATAEAIVQIANLDDSQWRRRSEQAYRLANEYTWQDAGKLFEAALIHASSNSCQFEATK